jgi:hypothetical protein
MVWTETRILRRVYNAHGNFENGISFFDLFHRSLKFVNRPTCY